MSKVAVCGAGSWGTAFSVVLADAGHDVSLWARREDLCATINEKRFLLRVSLGLEANMVAGADRGS